MTKAGYAVEAEDGTRSYFHTYTSAAYKTDGFVICVLDHGSTLEEVQENIKLRQPRCDDDEIKATVRPRYLVMTYFLH